MVHRLGWSYPTQGICRSTERCRLGQVACGNVARCIRVSWVDPKSDNMRRMLQPMPDIVVCSLRSVRVLA